MGSTDPRAWSGCLVRVYRHVVSAGNGDRRPLLVSVEIASYLSVTHPHYVYCIFLCPVFDIYLSYERVEWGAELSPICELRCLVVFVNRPITSRLGCPLS